MAFAFAKTAEGQLLEDRNKLKTAERTRKPFFQFKKNIKKPKKTNKKPDVERPFAIPYTKDQAGDQGNPNIQPRFSQRKSFSRKAIVVQPRYSQRKPFSGKTIVVQPRYSQRKPFSEKAIVVQPRFSQRKPFSNKVEIVNPRFSRREKKSRFIEVTPRTSQDIAGNYKPVNVIPRTSQETAGQGYEKWRANPRYTIRDKNSYRIINVQPRFSTPPEYVDFPVSGSKKGFLPSINLFTQPKAKYKQGEEPLFFGPKVPVVYTPSHSVAKHNQNLASYKKYKKNFRKKSPYSDQTEYYGPKVPVVYTPSHSVAQHNENLASYQKYKSRFRKKSPYHEQTEFFGPQVKRVYVPSHSVAKYNKSLESYQKYISRSSKKSPYHEQTSYVAKMKKLKKHKHAHPSANYLSAKYDGSPLIRETKRKTSVTWNRIFGNNTRPDGVEKKVKKAKFDKDEKDIWNNEEREYTR